MGSLLNSAPKIRVCGEVFNELSSNPDPTVMFFNQFREIHSSRGPGLTFKYLDWFNENFEGTYCSVAFRLMYNHLHKKPEIMSKLIWDRYKIIHLIRKNHLDALLSYRHAEKTNIYHVKEHVNMTPVHFEPLNLLRNIENRDKEIKRVTRILTTLPNPVLTITYDKLCRDAQKNLQKIVHFLRIPGDIPFLSFKSELKKINRMHHCDTIENYQEIKKMLSTTRFCSLIE
ncbi:MAG: hypothetical protein GY797_30275 [Deltaproteobacteria bacterium]|nr:hypothetical protein [Deltaproteobacteria bacterium]